MQSTVRSVSFNFRLTCDKVSSSCSLNKTCEKKIAWSVRNAYFLYSNIVGTFTICLSEKPRSFKNSSVFLIEMIGTWNQFELQFKFSRNSFTGTFSITFRKCKTSDPLVRSFPSCVNRSKVSDGPVSTSMLEHLKFWFRSISMRNFALFCDTSKYSTLGLLL